VEQTIERGMVVRWMTSIAWSTFQRTYTSAVVRVVDVHPRTVHIEVRRRDGRATQKWIKRTRVRPLNTWEA
jgi:hypothetical protein